ncbi:MAG TPA: restriction endonuclease [Anaerolineae bacterium]|nr:restriction endonuclease [Anaerolineae bacterium]
MLTRVEWFTRLPPLFERGEAPPPPPPPIDPAIARQWGWRLLQRLTAVFALWLAFRWLWSPQWLSLLPNLIQELLNLLEAASAFTLTFVWLGLAWRNRQTGPPPPVPQFTREQLFAMNPYVFEKYTAKLFRQNGHKVTLRGRSGDAGVDLELVSPLGKRAIVQCKRYQNTVGPDVVRELYGTLIHEAAAHAFLVTTADISDAAREWAADKPITLIDGATIVDIVNRLAESPPTS